MTESAGPSRLKLIFLLSGGLLAISFGSILVKLSQDAPSLTISFYRMFWAGVALTPFYFFSSGRRTDGFPKTERSSLAWWVVAGLALAFHFVFWIGSLRFTSVAVSVLLVSTSPVVAAALSWFVHKEILTIRGAGGIALSLVGVGVLLWNDVSSLRDWRGAVLAVAGAVMFGVYLVAGKRIRRTRSLIAYVYPTYVIAAVVLAILLLISRLPVAGFSNSTWFYLFLLGIGPQCLGHTSYNWALKYLAVTVVATLTVAEPVLASSLAFWILGEGVDSTVFVGGGFVAVGIVMVSIWGTE